LITNLLELFGLILIGVAWLVSDHYMPWLCAYNDSVAAAALLCLLAPTVSRLHSSKPRAVPAAFWALVAVACIPWLQWTLGQLAFFDDAMLGSVYVLGLALAVLCGFEWARRDGPGSATRMAIVLVAGAAVSAGIALMQGLEVGDLGLWALPDARGGRAGANLAQPNNLATLLGLGALAVLLLRERGRLGAGSAASLLVLLLLGAATTQSRAAMLFGPAVLLGWWLVRRRGVPVRTSLAAISLTTAAHWLLVYSWPLLQKALRLHDVAGTLAQRQGGGERLKAWAMFFDALSAAPWLGVGWLQTASAQLSVAERHGPLLDAVYQHAHNVLLELVLWCGYPLGLLLCAALLYWFTDRARRVTSVEAVVGLLMVTVLLIHSLLELPHHYAYFLIPVGWWAGRVEHDVGADIERGASWRWLPVGLSLAMVVCLLKDYPAVEESYRRALFETRRIGPAHAGELVPDAPFLPSLTTTLHWVRTPAVAGMSAQDLASLESSTKRFPYPASMVKLAYAWALNGRLPQAVQMFEKIYFVHGLPAYQVALGELHARVQAGDTALAALEAGCPTRWAPREAH
jgi:hypothetical protein